MFLNFSSAKLKDESSLIALLQWLHFASYLFTLIAEIFVGKTGILGGLLWLTLLLYLYREYFKSLSLRYYSYWGMSTFFFLYGLANLFSSMSDGYEKLSYLYFVTLSIMGLQAYLLASPLYYPRVRWWEYDFRYRYDLDALVKKEEEFSEARLCDLRREAGCLIFFESLDVGSIIELGVEDDGKVILLKGELMTMKEPLAGRGFIYGVRFLLEDKEAKNNYKKIEKIWLSRKARLDQKLKAAS